MYNQGTQAAVSRRRSVRTSGVGAAGRARQSRGRSQERTRLMQLAVCLVLFLAIFLWKGAFPQKMAQVRTDLLAMISTDYDFQAALSELGSSLAGEGTVLSDFGDFCTAVFGGSTAEPDQPQEFVPPAPEGVLRSELEFLRTAETTAERTAHYLDLDRYGLTLRGEPAVEEEPPAEEAAEETAEPEEPEAVPAAGTVLVFSDYDGEPLPNNYTMDQLSLGDLETAPPILGHLNSVYGYRDSPINGKYQFHGGVDIGGQMNDPIGAFAAGTVEYTGEDDSYGLYLQVDHGNGVKSFYAHCSKIVVVKGQQVALGEKVAEVGSTGDSTGPHLHLEMKFNKMHLNPAYYVDFLEA